MSIEQLTSLSLLKISGDDALEFLQGQLTNDVSLLENNWQYAGYCSPKGRLLALFTLWREDDSFYALVASDLIEPISQRLRMYVMRSKVTVAKIEAASILGISSNEGLMEFDPELAALITTAPQSMVTNNEHTALCINGRYLVISLVMNQDTQEEQTGHNWIKQNILEGIPTISEAGSDLFIPQMLNLDILDGINFKKGCYTGQEIVARMHYLGKLKQRMFVCEIEKPVSSEHPIKSTQHQGEKIFSDESAIKSIGTVVSAVNGFDKLLAVIRLGNKNETMFLANGNQLTVSKKQPYQIEQVDS